MKTGFLLFWVAVFAGWIMNIIQCSQAMPATIGEVTPWLVFKLVGIFVFPLGAILGWMGVF